MRIFYACDILLGANDGPATHVLELCKNLEKIGCAIVLFAPGIKKYREKLPFEIKYLPAIRNCVSLFYQPSLFISLFYYLLKKRPDIIYTRQEPFLIGPAILSKLFSIPYITEINGTMEEEDRRAGIPFPMIKVGTLIEKLCYRVAYKIITVTGGLKDYLIKKYNIQPRKIEVIQNGVDTNLFKPLSKRKIIEKFGCFHVGYIGSLYEYQGIDYLIRSMTYILKKMTNVKLIIIGRGPEKENLKNLSKMLGFEKDVIFIDEISHIEVPEYISAFDICICYPTMIRENITSPLKIYEYLSCGKPVIVSNIKGVGDLLKDLVVIAEPEDEKDLANEIIKLIESPQLRKQLGTQGRSFVLRGHSWEDVGYKTNKILQDTIKNGKSI